jgi:D-alanyl-D-alanine carboxypeptidase/D-alanyl-D-alanine-endopeptidase (penicillin-binding protein 4)
MTFNKFFTSILLILLGFSIASGQTPAQVRKLKKELAKISGSKEFKTATIGFCLMDVETGKILVEENAEKSLIPASTIKLITTGAGLALLGDTFRFKTELGYKAADFKNGILKGNLVIMGGGDPTLGSTRWHSTSIDTVLSQFYTSINLTGIKDITGTITPDNTIYSGENTPPGYNIEDIYYPYGASPSAINIFENQVNHHTRFSYLPDLENPPIIHYYFLTDDNTDKIDAMNNSFPIKTIDSLAIIEYKDSDCEPTFSTANILKLFLKYYLIKHNIKTGEQYVFFEEPFLTPTRFITSYYSPQLSDIATKTNHSSINLYAEGILRALSTNKYGYSTLDSSISITRQFWKNEVGDLKGLRMTDGSGLSRSNLCTPLLFCKMLTSYTKRDNFDSFYSTIPVAGKDGTVKNFAKGTAADGNAHIKSGSMSRVKCYAGYVTGKNGKLYAVSVMFNNFEPDATVTAACANLIGKVAELKGGKPKKTFVVNRGKL